MMTVESNFNKQVDDVDVVQFRKRNHSWGAETTRSNRSLESIPSAHSNTDLSSISSFSVYEDHSLHISNVKSLLAEKLKTKLADVTKALRNFDRHGTGKVLPSHLRNVLHVFCLPLSPEQFNSLIKEVILDEDGLISYKEFLLKLTENMNGISTFDNGVRESTCTSSLPTEELELRIKHELVKDLKNVIRSLWLYDCNRDGLIQKEELRNVLENYCFKMTDDQFRRLWQHYDPRYDGVVCYKDFLVKLGIHAESYKRYMPKETLTKDLKWFDPTLKQHAANYSKERIERRYAKQGRDDPSAQGKSLEDVEKIFKEKVEKSAPLLFRAFKMMDSTQSGYLHISDFHRILNHFAMPMSSALFMQLIKRTEIILSATNKICWYQFLRDICHKKDFDIKTHIPLSTSRNNKKMNSRCSVINQLKKHGKTPENCLKKVFTKFDHNKRRLVTRTELKRAINQSLVFPITEDQFKELMMYLDPGHTNVIDCQDFLSLFDFVSVDKQDDIHYKNELPQKQQISEIQYSNLSGKKLRTQIKKFVNKNFKNIEKALFTVDAEETSFISLGQLRSVLENFCFPLTDAQFQEILTDLAVTSDRINYNDFINHYKKSPYEDEEKWVNAIGKLMTNSTCRSHNYTSDEVIIHVCEAIKLHKNALLQEFRALDYCHVGIAKKEDLWHLLSKYAFRINMEQFKLLWAILPQNELGYLKYEEFLNEWAQSKQKQNPTSLASNKISQKQSIASDFRPASVVSLPESALTERSDVSRQRPKTASCCSSNSKFHCGSSESNHLSARPKSAASTIRSTIRNPAFSRSNSLVNLKINSSPNNCRNFFVEGKAIENSTPVVTQIPKQMTCTTDKNKENENKFSTSKENKFLGNVSSMSVPYLDEEPKQLIVKSKECSNENSKSEHMDYQALSLSVCEEHLQKAITWRWRDILRRCKLIDEGKEGTIMGEHMKVILERTGVCITEDIQKLLANKYGVQQGSSVNYWDFLHHFILCMNAKSKKSTLPRKYLQRTKIPVTLGQESTELYKILLLVRDKVLRNWRDLHQRFRKLDPKRRGLIDFKEFRKTLSQCKIQLSDDEVYYMLDYFDPNLTGKISYSDFLRLFARS